MSSPTGVGLDSSAVRARMVQKLADQGIDDAAVLEAKQLMGDNAGGLRHLIMHSRVYTNLQLQNLIKFIPNSQGVIEIQPG